MDTITTCPRGHELAENAVLCTVCWIRVEPEDPEVIAARKRRARRVWLPMFAAGAVLVGVGVGGAVEPYLAQPSEAVVVAGEAAPVDAAPAEPVVADPTVVEEAAAPVAVAVDPLAATVADPVGSTPTTCAATLRDQTADCSVAADEVALTVCVPQETSTVEVQSRASGTWEPVSSTATVGQASDCPAGTIAADLAMPAAVGSDGEEWRIVSRDETGERVWKSRITVVVG